MYCKMSSQNFTPVGNSGSLEDCHTNLYELTEIAGIQYKKFVSIEDNLVNSLDDPILKTYTKCLQAGILCSWINVKKEDKFSTLSDFSGYKRELWIFWYEGNDPLSMKNITLPSSLKEDERGNWKNGLTYEIRSILFKSLSLYFQRHFLSKGYVRMGLWHQMLYRPDRSSECQFGFSIKLFLHGESTICGTIDIRNVTVIRQITDDDLVEFNCNKKVDVILAPYGVKAQLTGRVQSNDDPRVNELQDEWLQYYPLTNLQKTGLEAKFVEIIIGNYRMYYPTCFVCVPMKNFSKRNLVKHNRKRTINELTSSNGYCFSFIGRKICDKIVKESITPMVNNLKKNGKRPWKYVTPYWRTNCTCGNCLPRSNNRLTFDKKDGTSNKSFHQRLKCPDSSFSHKSNNINESNCDKTNSPLVTCNTNQNDPSMPTLSPQMPQMSNETVKSNITNSNNQLGDTQQQTTHSKALNVELNDGDNFNELNGKYVTTKSQSNGLNSSSLSIGTVVSSTTPPPPSITPTNTVLPQNAPQYKIEHLNTPDIMKTENSEINIEALGVEPLPIGIEFNQKTVLSKKLLVPNINLVSNSLIHHHSRKPPSIFTTESIVSDIPLFPSLENNLTAFELSDNSSNNYEELEINNSLLNNCWLSFENCNNQINESVNSEGCSVSKRARKEVVHQKTEMNSLSHEILNNYRQIQTNFLPTPAEKMEPSSNIPDQIFDDSDDEEQHIKSDNVKYEVSDCGKLLSPTGSQMKMMRNTVSYSQITGNSMISSTGSGSLSAGELSYLYPTPPSLEGAPTTIGSPIERSNGGSASNVQTQSNATQSVLLNQHHSTSSQHSQHAQKMSRIALLSSGSNDFVTDPNVPNGSNSLSMLNNLSFNYQNWDEMDRDWNLPSVNVPLFCSGSKYTKQKSSVQSESMGLSFNHRHLHYVRAMDVKKHQHITYNQFNQNQRNIDYLASLSALAGSGSSTNHSFLNCINNKRPSTLMHLPPPKQQQRMAANNINSAPITPGSTNPPSVDSSIGTPRTVSVTPIKLGSTTNQNSHLQSQQQLHHHTSNHNSQQPPINMHSTFKLTTSNNVLALQLPFVNSLYFNVLLSDSILDIYRDHNFDSCNICVCSMSVLGNDVGLYIDDYQPLLTPVPQTPINNNVNSLSLSAFNRSLSTDDVVINSAGIGRPDSCKCGFSAIRNRHYAVNSNLFYEDEVEITGIRRQHNYTTQKFLGSNEKPDAIAGHLWSDLTSIYNEFGLGYMLDCVKDNGLANENVPENEVEFLDFNKAITRALEQSLEIYDISNLRTISSDKEKYLLSDICYFKREAPIPKNHNDQIRLLMSLRPLLQEAVNNSRLSMSSYTVDGPLTWKTFHKLAGRKNLESCEPQPIPRIMVLTSRPNHKESVYNNIPGFRAMKNSSAQANNTLQSSGNSSQFNSMFSHYTNINNGYISNQQGLAQRSQKRSNILKNFSLDGNPLCLTDGYPDKDKECLTISPYAIREWDKLNLEPIFKIKELAYAIVTPTDSGRVLQKSLINYFKELNRAYQTCKLGHHFSYRCDKSRDDIQSGFIDINTEQWNECTTVKQSSGNISGGLLSAAQYKYWLRELSQHISSECQAEDMISRMCWYADQSKKLCVRSLLQYGVNRRNGTRCSLFPVSNGSVPQFAGSGTCTGGASSNTTSNSSVLEQNSSSNAGVSGNDSEINLDKSDLTKCLELLLSPSNGCGPQSRTLNTHSWNTADRDVYLVIYLVNPFTYTLDWNSARTSQMRLGEYLLSRTCDRIRAELPAAWRNRITFHQLSISRILAAGSVGGLTSGSGDSDGSSIGARDSSASGAGACQSGSVSWWSLRWTRQPSRTYWICTAMGLYSSVRRCVMRVAGLQQLLQKHKVPLCPSADTRCTMGRSCLPVDAPGAVSQINANRSLTGFGPAGSTEQLTIEFIQKLIYEYSENMNDLEHISMKLYTPSYILAPTRAIEYQAASYIGQQHQGGSTVDSVVPGGARLLPNGAGNHVTDPEYWGSIGDQSGVLFVAYCLSHDQRFLLAVCTDQTGSILRHVQINVAVPQLHARKRASPRRIGLAKLWEFIVEVVSETIKPWRLVIGRLGRAGHGELRGWNGLLSRQNLMRVNQRFREECSMCHVWSAFANGSNHHGNGPPLTGGGPNSNSGGYFSGMGNSLFRSDLCGVQCPALVSGCFVSLECQPSFRIFPGSVKPEERASSQLQVCTPRDIGVTHLLVFPTSTSAGAIQNEIDIATGGMVNIEELLEFRFSSEELNMEMNDNMVFGNTFDTYGGVSGAGGADSGLGGPLGPGPGSGLHGSSLQSGAGGLGGIGAGGIGGLGCGLGGNSVAVSVLQQDEGQQLMQQPLAMGYYISTASGGPLPPWMAPDASHSLPSCFKAALHLQTSLISQEDGAGGLTGVMGAPPHPLDSHQTCDVLHFVLDCYHALSWLTMDPITNERRSCLPVHMLCLAQLYQGDNLFLS